MKKGLLGFFVVGCLVISGAVNASAFLGFDWCPPWESCKDEPATRVTHIYLKTKKDAGYSAWNAPVLHKAGYDNGTTSDFRLIWHNREGTQMIVMQPQYVVYYVPWYRINVSRNGDTPLYLSAWQAPWANYNILRETEALEPNQYNFDGARYCTVQARLKIGHNNGNPALYNLLYYNVGYAKMRRIAWWSNGGWVRADREAYMIP